MPVNILARNKNEGEEGEPDWVEQPYAFDDGGESGVATCGINQEEANDILPEVVYSRSADRENGGWHGTNHTDHETGEIWWYPSYKTYDRWILRAPENPLFSIEFGYYSYISGNPPFDVDGLLQPRAFNNGLLGWELQVGDVSAPLGPRWVSGIGYDMSTGLEMGMIGRYSPISFVWPLPPDPENPVPLTWLLEVLLDEPQPVYVGMAEEPPVEP